MEVEFVQTLKDITALNVFMVGERPWWRRNLFWLGGCLVVMGTGLLLGYFAFGGSRDAKYLFYAIFYPLNLLLWTWGAHDWKRRVVLRVRRFAKRPENKRMVGCAGARSNPRG